MSIVLTLGIAAIALILFMVERFPADITALGVVVALIFLLPIGAQVASVIGVRPLAALIAFWIF